MDADRHSSARPELGRRRHARLRLRVGARVMTLFDTGPATLLDLSATGARLRCGADPAIGAEILIRWGAHEAFGVCRWKADGMIGLEFDEALDVATLLATRAMASQPDTTGLVRMFAAEFVQGPSPRSA